MNEIWYRPASDEEIAECPGDYIGCEICQNLERCCLMMTQRLQKAIDAKGQLSQPSQNSNFT